MNAAAAARLSWAIKSPICVKSRSTRCVNLTSATGTLCYDRLIPSAQVFEHLLGIDETACISVGNTISHIHPKCLDVWLLYAVVSAPRPQYCLQNFAFRRETAGLYCFANRRDQIRWQLDN